VSVKAEITLDLIVAVGYTIAVWPVNEAMSYTTRLVFLFLTGAVARRLHSNAELRSAQVSQLREVLEVEKEKSRLAREIHDGVGREIVNAILGLEVAARTSEKKTPDDNATPGLIRENVAILRSAMDSTRQLIFETRPWTLDESAGKLTDRIEEYARRFADRTGVAVAVDSSSEIDDLPQPTAFAILRVMQESLNNAAKHAQASSINIHAICVDKEVRLTVVDDGAGFDLSTRAGDGIGLKSMRERAATLRGRVDIVSAPGQGTAVTLIVPVG
jgi:signal transduction histidine kinase